MEYYNVEGIPFNDYYTSEQLFQDQFEVFLNYDETVYTVTNSGYICCPVSGQDQRICMSYATCNWRLAGGFPTPTFSDATVFIDGEYYLKFITPNGDYRVVTPTGGNCVNQTTITSVLDPFTGEQGLGCKVSQSDWNNVFGVSLNIINSYRDRFLGFDPEGNLVSCDYNWSPTIQLPD